ncbi:Short chain dehydrogenase citE [Paramyrothecium foliicola]|nr:Short chain dehydrogenase citE [Paramyrothecium foliicola]
MEKAMHALPAYTGDAFTNTEVHKVPESRKPEALRLPSPFVAVITGASRGIGKATAESFAKAGATGLILTSRTVASLDETNRCCLAVGTPDLKVSLVQFDSGNEEHTINLRDTVVAEHGRLDLLLNNAGFVSTDPSAFGKIGDVRSDQFRITMEGNYFGRFLTMKYLMPTLLSTSDGFKGVINVTSICSHFVDRAATSFNISVLASNRLTEITAGQYADQGLVFYSVHPGFVATTLPPGMPAEVMSMAPDEPGLCGSLCLWLVKKRHEWLSGRYISSNWDTEELEGKREEIVQRDLLKARMSV